MGIKSLISTVAFAGAFTLSSGLAMLWPNHKPAPTYTPHAQTSKCSSRKAFGNFDAAQQQRISQFMQRDIANGERRDVKLATLRRSELVSSDKYADAVLDYVEESTRLDYSALPADFRDAWRAHLNAWRDHANLLNSVKQNPNKGLGPDFYETYQAQDEAISDTWMDVKQVAYRYGATFTE